MTGMKEGAGEDPFEDDSSASTPDERDRLQVPHSDTSDTETERDSSRSDRNSTQMTVAKSEIPYKLRRNGVQDGRDRVPLFLQEESKTEERRALREMENRFADNVTLTDLREALVLVGLDNLDDVERQLEKWGYGMTFD